MINICITSRLSSLPIVLAYKKGFFEEFGVRVTLHVNTHHKAIHSLLDAGRVEAGEITTISFLQDFYLKKSKLKRIFKGLYLYHSPLSFYSRFQFKPEDLTRNKAYFIPVPHTNSVERFLAEKFLEEYAPKNPIKIRYVDTPGFLEEKEFLKPNCLGIASDPFLSPFLRNYHDFKEVSPNSIINDTRMYPTTLLAFSGDAIAKMGREVSGVLLAVKKAIDFLNSHSKSPNRNLWDDLNLNQFYPHLRVGETKSLLNSHPFIES